MTLIPLLIAAGTVMLMALAGVVVVWKHLGVVIERNLSVLVSFSAGVFLLIAFRLAEEVLGHTHQVYEGVLWIGLGALVVWVAFRFLPSFHHHHDTRSEDCVHAPIDARRILISDGIHNVGDGILLAAAFAVSAPLGIIATLSVLAHEVVQEISEFFVLRQAGLSTSRALLYNFLVSSTILIGAIGGYFLLDTFERIEVPLLGLAGGALLVVVVYDLIPHSIRTSRRTAEYGTHIVWFIIGVMVMYALSSFAGHGHEEAALHNASEATAGPVVVP